MLRSGLRPMPRVRRRADVRRGPTSVEVDAMRSDDGREVQVAAARIDEVAVVDTIDGPDVDRPAGVVEVDVRASSSVVHRKVP